jgi:MFS transporter, DHA1 family, multidrug resistance protein
MSLAFMVFMAIPIVTPGIGQVILSAGGSWHLIFVMMAVLATAIGLWAWFRLPETLHPEYRRELKLSVILDGFRAVFINRVAFFYGLCGMLFFSAMFGFIICSQQIFVGIYGLGPYFPVAFASVAALMAVANFLNSQVVKRFGMRRISHLATLLYIAAGATILTLALMGPVNFWVYYVLLVMLQFVFAWATSNMNSLSMEPLGAVAGTAAAVFGFMQTVGGALIGTFIGQQFNGTLIPNSLAYVVMGVLVLTCVLIAERGRLFGVGVEYQTPPAAAMAE